MTDYRRDMGERIKPVRKKMKITQEEMAELLNISVKHYSAVERGLAGLSVENLIRLSSILHLSLDYMIKGEPVPGRWDRTIEALRNVPEQKSENLCKIIDLIIRMSQD